MSSDRNGINKDDNDGPGLKRQKLTDGSVNEIKNQDETTDDKKEEKEKSAPTPRTQSPVSMDRGQIQRMRRMIKNPQAHRRHTHIPCIRCWKAKTRCSVQRPCPRCVRMGYDDCQDRPASIRFRRRQNIVRTSARRTLAEISMHSIHMSKE
eukprot:212326_1